MPEPTPPGFEPGDLFHVIIDAATRMEEHARSFSDDADGPLAPWNHYKGGTADGYDPKTTKAGYIWLLERLKALATNALDGSDVPGDDRLRLIEPGICAIDDTQRCPR